MLLHDTIGVKKNHHNFIKVVIFVINYKGEKKVNSEYLCHLTFTIFKFILKSFLFLENMSMISPYIFLKKKKGSME